MTQQVVHCRIVFPNSQTLDDQSSFGLTFEATGSDTSLPLTTQGYAGGHTSVEALILAFLNGTVTGQTHPIAYYISEDCSRAANAVYIQEYDVTAHLDGSAAGSPIGTYNLTLGAGGGVQALPQAVAACVGYRAAYGTDIEHGTLTSLPSDDAAIDQGAPTTHQGITRPRARDRGRFYLGPLYMGASNSYFGPATGGDALAAGFVTDLQKAVDSIAQTQNSGLSDQFNWVVWSRRAASVKSVAYYYVDEGFAVQRRRGDTTESRVHSWVAR